MEDQRPYDWAAEQRKQRLLGILDDAMRRVLDQEGAMAVEIQRVEQRVTEPDPIGDEDFAEWFAALAEARMSRYDED